MMLKLIYAVFIGVFLAAFIGFGIAAFYPQPKLPVYPERLSYPKQIDVNDPEYQKQQQQQITYEQQMRQYQQSMETYNRNVSVVSIAASIVIMVVSLTIFRQVILIADGLLLGGVLTLLYGILRGFSNSNDMFRFVIVTIGFGVSLILGYLKFIKQTQPAAKSG